MTRARQAERCAEAACSAFESWSGRFREITRRAGERFVRRDWRGLASDAVERLDLHDTEVARLTETVRGWLGDAIGDAELWPQVARDYRAQLPRLGGGPELAVTFFNSLTHRLFGRDTPFELGALEAAACPIPEPALSRFERRTDVLDLVRRLLEASPFAGLFQNVEDTARAIATEIERAAGSRAVTAIEGLRPPFYRSSEAFLVGRVLAGSASLPLAIAFLNLERGVVADTVLLEEDEISIVFSFTRSYFLVDLEQPGQAVPFLGRLMPKKPVAELYTALGHNKHGKTVFHRELTAHLGRSTERFVAAPGDPGLVMIVFTMPSYDVVFKVIRDRALPPKTTTREEVRSRYDLVFRHDRAGRLADAQAFERLRLDASRFDPELLDELQRDASETVHVEGGSVLLEHVYTERRMQPLNLHLREAKAARAKAAVLDYGRAIRDLAASNIFPGDLLLKNFGVTRHGRVVFYDYDELCLLTQVRFRDLPQAAGADEELAGEHWFYVGPRDVFPEELRTFIGLSKELLALLETRHAEIFDPAWWRAMQRLHEDGILTRILPYPRSRRLRGPGTAQPC